MAITRRRYVLELEYDPFKSSHKAIGAAFRSVIVALFLAAGTRKKFGKVSIVSFFSFPADTPAESGTKQNN